MSAMEHAQSGVLGRQCGAVTPPDQPDAKKPAAGIFLMLIVSSSVASLHSALSPSVSAVLPLSSLVSILIFL